MDLFFDKEPFASIYNSNSILISNLNIYISILYLIILYIIYSFYQFIYDKNKTYKNILEKNQIKSKEASIRIYSEIINEERERENKNDFNMVILDEEFKINDYYHKNFYKYF